MAYALNCAGLQCRGSVCQCGSCGGVKGVCNAPHKYAATCHSIICATVGAYGIRPELRDLQCCDDGLRCGFSGGIQGVCDMYYKRIKVANQKIAPLVGAYCIRPGLRGFAMLRRWFAVRFMRWHTGRMQYAPTIIANPQPITIPETLRKLHRM